MQRVAPESTDVSYTQAIYTEVDTWKYYKQTNWNVDILSN